jgi:HEAT repeat protein
LWQNGERFLISKMRKLKVAFVLALVLLPGCRGGERPVNVAPLIEDLKGADKEKSGRANLALIRTGPPAVPAILELLATDDPRLRLLALTTLWGMGARAESAVPTLAETLSDPDPEIRIGAAMALENMGPSAAAAVPALIKALSDGESRVRQTSVKALGNIGPAARDAVPVISRAVKRGPWPEAEEAIRRIQGRPEETPSPEAR